MNNNEIFAQTENNQHLPLLTLSSLKQWEKNAVVMEMISNQVLKGKIAMAELNDTDTLSL